MKNINELLFKENKTADFIKNFTGFIKKRCKDAGDSYDLSSSSNLTFSLDEFENMPDDLKERFTSIQTIGCLKLDKQYVAMFLVRSNKDLNERSFRRKQFDFAKKILLNTPGKINNWFHSKCINFASGLFLFLSQDCQSYRLSLVECKKDQNQFKRYTFFVSADQRNRTFCDRIGSGKKWETFADLKEVFSVEKLSDDFFNAYKDHYQDFVEYATGKRFVKSGSKWIEKTIHAPNNNVMGQFTACSDPEKALRDYVKKMMGRLVFLQFLQKRGWLGVPEGADWGSGDKEYLKKLFENSSDKDNFLEAVLEKLFFNTLNQNRGDDAIADAVLAINGGKVRIPYLNGGLFEKDKLDAATVKFPADCFRDLFDTFERYNFTIDENEPNEKVVGVDPEMLGRIFENLLEDNKDKGAFYTPKEIVQYMCEESLIAYLGDTKENRNLVKEFDASGITNASDVLAKLQDVKICDPAIGSGAFPMGMLNILYRIRMKLENLDDTAENIVRIKKEIIQNNIYGVDIEAGAVDIARLRFWLSIVVDEDKPIPLPNLDYKIMQGNSLLEQYNGVDLKLDFRATDKKGKKVNTQVIEQQMCFAWDDESRALENLKAAMNDFFEPDASANKVSLRAAIDRAVKDYIKTKCGNAPSINHEVDAMDLNDKPFFLWHLYFADVFVKKGGFDIVIGNPPYIDSETMKNVMPDDRVLLKKTYKNLSGNWDIYMAFWELANILSSNIFIFITPDKWLSKPFGSQFRQNIVRKKLHSIAMCGSDVFDNATVDAVISLFKSKVSDTTFGKFNKECIYEKIAMASIKSLSSPYYIDCYFSPYLSLLKKIEKNTKCLLSELAPCENACATSDAYDLETILENNKNADPNLYFKLVNTGTIAKFKSLWGMKPITYLGHHELYPVINKEQFEKLIGRTYCRRAYSPKIIFKGLNLLDAFIDENASYIPGKTTLCICSENIDCLKLLCGIINSKLIFFYIKTKVSSSSYCGGITFTPEVINSLPIPQITDSEKKDIIHLVDRIQISDDSNQLLKQLDDIVYSLYGLTQEEISIVEESLKPPAKEKGKKAAPAAVPAEPLNNDDNNDDRDH